MHPTPQAYLRKMVSSHEFYRWPEFQALAERLGIPLDLRTLGLSILIGPDANDPVRVEQFYQAVDYRKEIDTTSLVNERWVTKEPKGGEMYAER